MAVQSTSGAPPPDGEVAGQVLAGRYRLERRIASGGMARVWEAGDELLKRRVAVKILHPHLAGDDTFVRRFRAEAVSAARLTHPSIVSVYDTVVDGGVNAIVMELVTGTTLRDDLDQHGPMKLAAALAVGTQVADALQAAHAAGLVHRDVKPANILLSADGRVLVTDFGIAKAAADVDVTAAGSLLGTAKYLAPEQVEGHAVDGRADLYALGVVLYESLTGRPPFVADTDTGTALARLHRDPTPPRQLRPDIPVGVEAVVLRAMARRREDRFADAATMRRALLAAGGDPRHATAVAQAAAAASTGERPAARPQPAAPLPPPPSGQHRPVPPPPPPPRPAPPAPAPVAPGPVASARRGDEPDPGVARRRWPRRVVGLLLLAGLAAGAAALVDRASEPGRPLPIDTVDDFDPYGDNFHERPDLVGLVTDGDPDTAWQTEGYGAADLGAKPGVGLVVTATEPADLSTLTVTTPEGGWSADIYVADGFDPDARSLDDWGEVAAHVADVAVGATDVHLGDRRGQAVLIWFTALNPTGEGTHTATVSSVGLFAR